MTRLLINTRPAERALALTQAAQQAGLAVFELPLLHLEPEPWNEHLDQLYQQLLEVNVIVVVSPMAVECGMRYLQQAGILLTQLQHIQWVAVGQKTAECLATYHIKSAIPEVETSEGMLKLPLLEDLPAQSKIAFWRGEGGRQFMMQQLHQQGMQILNFVLYHRALPLMSRQEIPRLRQLLDHYQYFTVLISSEASWKYWLSLWQDDPHVISSAHYLVLGERVSQLMQQQFKQTLQLNVLADLSPQRILEHIV